jgi:hypothetical protein
MALDGAETSRRLINLLIKVKSVLIVIDDPVLDFSIYFIVP